MGQIPTSDQWPPARLADAGGLSLREAIAAYVMAHKDQIRAVARRRLSPTARRVYDSEEVVSSVLRRLDGMAVRGTLRTSSDQELWGLIKAIARNTVINKSQLLDRAQKMLTEDSEYGYQLVARITACEGDDEATLLVQRMLSSLKNPVDRQILAMVLRGATHRAIAGLLSLSEPAVRQKWKSIRDDLLARFQSEAPHD